MIFAGIKGDGRNSREILAHLISFLPLSTQCRRRLSLRRCSHGATASLSRSGRSAAAAALAPRARMARPAGVAHPVVLGGVRASLQSMAHLAVFRRGRSCRGGSAGFGALTGGHGAGCSCGGRCCATLMVRFQARRLCARVWPAFFFVSFAAAGVA